MKTPSTTVKRGASVSVKKLPMNALEPKGISATKVKPKAVNRTTAPYATGGTKKRPADDFSPRVIPGGPKPKVTPSGPRHMPVRKKSI